MIVIIIMFVCVSDLFFIMVNQPHAMAVEEHINRWLSVKTSRRPLATPLTLAWCCRVQSEAKGKTTR